MIASLQQRYNHMSYKRFRDGLRDYADEIQGIINNMNTHANRYEQFLEDPTLYFSLLPKEICEVILEHVELTIDDYKYYDKISELQCFIQDDEILNIFRNKFNMNDKFYALCRNDPYEILMISPSIAYLYNARELLEFCNIKSNYVNIQYKTIITNYPEICCCINQNGIYYSNTLKELIEKHKIKV